MTRIRISPSASVLRTEIGVLLRTDLGTFQLEGSDVAVFLDRMLPLLDGTRDRDAIAADLSGYSSESIHALLDVLAGYGLLLEETDGSDEPSGEAEFFRTWLGDPAIAVRRLRAAQVVVIGAEPWTAPAVEQLALAGVGTLFLVGEEQGGLAADAAALAPGARIEPHSPADLEEVVAGLDEEALLLVTANVDERALLRKVAIAGQEHQLRSLHAHIEGLEAVVGPLVVPGDSACWECYRQRRLANADHPQAARAIDDELLAGRARSRGRTYLPAMSRLLGDVAALETIKVLSEYAPSELAGRTRVQNLLTLETSIHSVVRMPWCDVCGGPSRARPRERGGRRDAGSDLDVDDPSELRRRLAGWVDERTGVVRFLGVATPAAPEPEVPVTATAVLGAYADDGHSHEPEIASGKGLAKVDALRSAVGEAIERYSAARYRRDRLLRRPAADLEEAFVDPRDLCLYDEEQYRRPDFPYARYDPANPIEWARARWLDTGDPVLVPALLAYMNYRTDPAGHFCQVTSNGLAAGANDDDAALRATLELVERDAFMLAWLTRRPGRPLAVDGALPGEVLEAVRQLEPLGVHVELALLDAGVELPVVACLGFGDGTRWPGLTLALAADTDPVAAATKAVLEHGHVGPYIRRQMVEQVHPVPERPEQVRSLLDHALYYAAPERTEEGRFLLEGPPASLSDLPRPTADPAEVCRSALAEAGVRVAIADVTSPDVALGPFRVARALGIDMQQIHFGYGLERSANPRLGRSPSELNRTPHPLA